MPCFWLLHCASYDSASQPVHIDLFLAGTAGQKAPRAMEKSAVYSRFWVCVNKARPEAAYFTSRTWYFCCLWMNDRALVKG